MWTTWAALRLVKFVAMAALGAGVLLAVSHPSQLTRLRAAQRLAAPALIASWLAGYGMMKATDRGLGEGFIGWALLASFVALHGALLAGMKARPSVAAVGLAVAGLLSAIGVMVARDPGPLGAVAAIGLPVLGGVAAAAWLRPDADPRPADIRPDVRGWFAAIAWTEGASLVFMLFVSMPLRKLAHVELDGGQGWIGWVHGIFVFLYVQALLDAKRALGWSLTTTAVGFVASLIPFGTFFFERRMSSDASGPVLQES